MKFANKSLSLDLKNDIKMFTLPGVGEYVGGVSYFLANRDEVISLVNKEFNVFNTDLISEDFCVISSESIYRPAVSIVTDEEYEFENEDELLDEDDETASEEDIEDDAESDESDEENSDEEETDDNDVVSSDSKKPSENKLDNKSDNKSGNKSEDKKDKDKTDSAETTKSDEGTSSDEQSNKPSDDTSSATPAVKEEIDENYQLLLDMAA